MTIRNVAKLTAAAAAAVLASAAMTGAAAAADEAASPTISFNAGASTDYIFRGVSQTNEKTQGFAGVDVGYGMFYAGAWTSNVDFSYAGDTSTSQEIDLYGGVKPVIGSLNLDLGAVYYGYVDQPTGSPVDYWEFYGKASHAFGPATIGAAVYWSPEFTGKTGDAWYYEANAAYTVNDKLSFSGAIGRQNIELASDYTTWNLGATFMAVKNIGIDVRYYDTNISNFDAAKGRVVASVKASF